MNGPLWRTFRKLRLLRRELSLRPALVGNGNRAYSSTCAGLRKSDATPQRRLIALATPLWSPDRGQVVSTARTCIGQLAGIECVDLRRFQTRCSSRPSPKAFRGVSSPARLAPRFSTRKPAVAGPNRYTESRRATLRHGQVGENVGEGSAGNGDRRMREAAGAAAARCSSGRVAPQRGAPLLGYPCGGS